MATFGTFVSGQVLTAAELNSAGAWSSYTPTFTQSATITKTVNWARYTQLNDLVIVNLKMTASSAGTANNVIKVGLPVNASANNFLMGTMFYQDDSIGGNNGGDPLAFSIAIYDSTSTVKFREPNSGQNAEINEFVGLTICPQDWTIASGDVVYVQLTYEAA